MSMGHSPDPPGGAMSVGRPAVRVDAPDKLTGAADYPADRIPEDALWAMAVFTDQPHARLIDLDFSAAEAVPGVVAVLGSADVPVNEYGLVKRDQPVFVGLRHTGRAMVACEVSRWEADHLALVVAETPEDAPLRGRGHTLPMGTPAGARRHRHRHVVIGAPAPRARRRPKPP